MFCLAYAATSDETLSMHLPVYNTACHIRCTCFRVTDAVTSNAIFLRKDNNNHLKS